MLCYFFDLFFCARENCSTLDILSRSVIVLLVARFSATAPSAEINKRAGCMSHATGHLAPAVFFD